MTRSFHILIGLFIALWACLAPLQAANKAPWKWTLPTDLYKKLNHLERTQFDKATALFRKGEQHKHRRKNDAIKFYKSSAMEWQKIRTQMGDTLDEPVFAYIVLIQAYSNHLALNRNAAIKTYTEVVDYFPDEIWVVVPALYWQAMAHFENGDQLKGYKSLTAIADDKDYSTHPLAAGALRRLADNSWANKEFDKAAKHWQQVWKNFHKTNPTEARDALWKLRSTYIFQNQYSKINQSLIETTGKEPHKGDTLVDFINKVNKSFGQPWDKWYYKRFFSAQKAKSLANADQRKFTEWVITKRNAYKQLGHEWTYLKLMITVSSRTKLVDAKTTLKEALDYLKQAGIDPRKNTAMGRDLLRLLVQNKRLTDAQVAFGGIAERLRNAKMAEKDRHVAVKDLVHHLCSIGMQKDANTLLDMYPDTISRLWAQSSIYSSANQWPDVLKVLEELENQNDPETTRKAKHQRANIYKDKTREYEKAIPLYIEVGNPRHTLWPLVHCYRQTKKRDKAMNTLTEIANFFPDQAARAMITKADFYRADGMHKKAIAHYRQILAHPKWKKTRQASKSHQILEEYGIKTGGAVVNRAN